MHLVKKKNKKKLAALRVQMGIFISSQPPEKQKSIHVPTFLQNRDVNETYFGAHFTIYISHYAVHLRLVQCHVSIIAQ